jgi:hypothetical protein
VCTCGLRQPERAGAPFCRSSRTVQENLAAPAVAEGRPRRRALGLDVGSANSTSERPAGFVNEVGNSRAACQETVPRFKP